ncbi:hypothetical protein BN2497_6311 [Janthinobacterium sp. CG23_2]|nr:hypothetical protein BN2497_6311 [Janthinobacterium sp. CG23_2]CUU29553.1 hypothetical protein BN3177_6311 [Janthinobacterium sp. CG23_2]
MVVHWNLKRNPSSASATPTCPAAAGNSGGRPGSRRLRISLSECCIVSKTAANGRWLEVTRNAMRPRRMNNDTWRARGSGSVSGFKNGYLSIYARMLTGGTLPKAKLFLSRAVAAHGLRAAGRRRR